MDNKYHLVTRGLEEVIGTEKLKSILETRNLKIYWGTAPTGRPHIAYFIPLLKIADFLKADCEVTILFADIHACLDNMKTSWEVLQHRVIFYERVIQALLKSLDVDITKLKFVRGSDFQYSKEYVHDIYRLLTISTEHDAKKAGTEVVKQTKNPLLSGLVYPLLQALDEQYLDVDAQFGGTDQRKIFTFAEKHLPMLQYEKRIHLMNYMMPGLTGKKMGASEPDSKIDILDDENTIRIKIRKMYCPEKEINPVCSLFRFIIFPSTTDTIIIKGTNQKYGMNMFYDKYDDLENDFINGLIHPDDLKDTASRLLWEQMKKFQDILGDISDLIKKAY